VYTATGCMRSQGAANKCPTDSLPPMPTGHHQPWAHPCHAGCTGLQLRVLVEAGAEVGLKDRWGATALSEAQRVGAREATSYLLPLTRQAGGV